MDRPNVILILADDLGFSDLGCFGAESATPTLDRMAADGLRMTQMYNCARCCPSRAALLTGLYPHQVGVGHMMQPLAHPSYQGYIHEDCLTIAEVLRSAGYRTYMSGKWHVGREYVWGESSSWNVAGEPGHPRPVDRGFDRHFGTLTGAGSYYMPETLIDGANFVSLAEIADDFYYTDAITDHAVEFIREAAGSPEPFFLYLAHVAPHWPLHAREPDIARFTGDYAAGWDEIREQRRARQIAMGILSEDNRLSERTPLATPWSEVEERLWEDARMSTYAAQIYRMDCGIGRILSELEGLGLSEDTLILFVSDNGGCAERLEARGVLPGPLAATKIGRPVVAGNVPSVRPGPEWTFMSYDAGWANVSNTPFRLFKHWLHEGGIATPFVAYRPGSVPTGAIVHQPAHFIDIAVTIAELAGAEWPQEKDGRPVRRPTGESFASLLSGGNWERQAPMYWEHEGNRAIRAGNWKLVAKQGRDWELYDMAYDRSETDDVSSRRPEIVRELSALYSSWAEALPVVAWETVREWSAAVPQEMNWSWVVQEDA